MDLSQAADLFFLLINKLSCFSCSQCTEWGWGGAFQQRFTLLRRWQHAFLRLHRDTFGCGLELCRQLLWVTVPVECALNNSFEERAQVVELQTCHGRQRGRERFWCSLLLPTHSPQRGCARLTAPWKLADFLNCRTVAYFDLDLSVAGVGDDGSLQGNYCSAWVTGNLTVLPVLAMEIPT